MISGATVKDPQPVDRHVGSRVRMRRMMVGMSQEKLGQACGITFQQVQKYEKGTNRMGASRLHQISRVPGCAGRVLLRGRTFGGRPVRLPWEIGMHGP